MKKNKRIIKNNKEKKMNYIEEIKNKLIPIFDNYNVKEAILFGSFAKNTATEKSDIDLLVDSRLKGISFFGLLEDITNAIGKEVDLIDVSQIEKGSQIEKEIKNTGVIIYG